MIPYFTTAPCVANALEGEWLCGESELKSHSQKLNVFCSWRAGNPYGVARDEVVKILNLPTRVGIIRLSDEQEKMLQHAEALYDFCGERGHAGAIIPFYFDPTGRLTVKKLFGREREDQKPKVPFQVISPDSLEHVLSDILKGLN